MNDLTKFLFILAAFVAMIVLLVEGLRSLGLSTRSEILLGFIGGIFIGKILSKLLRKAFL